VHAPKKAQSLRGLSDRVVPNHPNLYPDHSN
jgi:hypothetical protein